MNDYSNFRPRTYLEEYYSTVPTESRELMAFLVHAFSRIPMNSSVLDFGTGPTLYSPMAASRRDARVVCSDYTPANRDEIRAWWKGDPNAFDWREHVHVMMDLEQGIGATTITETMIREREAQIRRCIVDVVHCDALRDPVLDGGYSQFDVIVSNLCLEAAARNLEEWHGCMARVSALLRPGGYLIMCAVQNGDTYAVGSQVYPVVRLQKTDFAETLLASGYVPESIEFSWANATHPVHPYDGLLFVTARKSG